MRTHGFGLQLSARVLALFAALMVVMISAFSFVPVKAAVGVAQKQKGAKHIHVLKTHRGTKHGDDNSSPLVYNGGPVMQSTSTTYAIFWEPPTLQDGTATQVSATYNSLIERYFNDIGGSGVYDNNTQYYDSTGHIVNSSTFGGAYVDTSAYPDSGCSSTATPHGCMTDAQVQSEVAKVMAANGWSGGLNHLFFVFTSADEGSCTDANATACAFTQYCAYHSFFDDSNNQPILYGNMPYTGTDTSACGLTASPNNDSDADSTINVISHEHMEAVTDPLLNAWYDGLGDEIGDKCAWNFGSPAFDNGAANVQWNNNYYLVQQEWSNADSGCTLTGQGTQQSGSLYVGSNDGYVYALKSDDGTLLWRYKTGGAASSSPVVDNGVVYVGSKDRYVYALNTSDGSLLWRYKTGGAVYSSPTIDNDSVYIGSSDGYVYALKSEDGSLLWRYKTHGSVYSSPTVDNDVVYVGSRDRYVYALSESDGKLLWRYQTRNMVDASPVVDNDIVFVGSKDRYVYALSDSDGKLLWRYSTGGYVTAAVAVDNDVVYGGSSKGNVYALNSNNGSLVWSYRLGGAIDSAPALDNNELFIGASNGYLTALDESNGTLLWRYQAGGHIDASPTIDSNIVYFGTSKGLVVALDESNGTLLWHYQTGGAVASAPVVS